MKYITTKYEGLWQLQELDRIPGLCWPAKLGKPSEFSDILCSHLILCEEKLRQGTLSENPHEYLEVSFSEFKGHARRLLGCKWEQEDL